MSPDYSAPYLPASLRAERQGYVGILWLKRGQKHVALDGQTILGIDTYFANLAEGIKAVVFVSKDGDSSDARDLNEWMNGTTGNIEQAHLWRRACDSILFGEVPVVAEGQTMGLSTYLGYNGRGLAKGLELAEHIAANATLSLFSGF